MSPEWGRSWKRTDLDLSKSFFQVVDNEERAIELARLNLPAGTKFYIVQIGEEFAFLYLGENAKEFTV